MADEEHREEDATFLGEGEDVADLGDDKGVDDEVDDPELEAMKQRVKEMEEEARKLKEMQSQVEQQMAGATSLESKEEIDSRSVYVGNVDYGATPEELQSHFASCGAITRVTILCDTFTGHPKGFAYVEFSDKSSIDNAVVLDESTFRGRQLKVMPKRTNVPGLKMRSRGRGRPGMGGGGFRGGFDRGFGYAPRPRARFRNRRASFTPY